ncbi:transcription cofactor vestigial-like protein 1 [Gadus chalcogrammus]|uniref:transcription cofactor vestigial-like protein 1 n=1 Tax=Gadus chalcogrammus TaxID=1042646 RepID=UPI0024C4CE69|nr:transcription cofactor vestigial-like protein 1 [Gadus chalcogrammus]XP_056456397.1 transcription cofactor vestigial-like protein 1 [Gadus chalcogrammus]XP_056456398.1 transcription cofactor vestigial-like protein 1 [Gadus chalcogrammus]XP_056456399.1 transcription cofactor vestigial-like protein 1 [Gadus chalcogrammus]XP_056456400.1 transcription cofactor vestigial-like protein 1 [Gadus chalcogrammus]XP_056456401.1 transcription cofactor vestigial-like protein 1 [Gadus chalcogrammus]
MADVGGSPFSMKMEENSQSVILTYFQGDIGSMVDAHFSRALARADRAKPIKPKKSFKFLKSEDPTTCQWTASSPGSYPEAQFLSRKGSQGGLPFSPVDQAPSGWQPFPVRQAGGPGLPPIPYSISAEGQSLTEQQYATSLLNLLHSDRSEMGPGLASGSKPELMPSWTGPAAFRDALDPSADFDPGRNVDKKVLYWY